MATVKNLKKISIVIPCYNEQENIKYLFDRLKKNVERNAKKYNFEIIIVNDGSRDSTASKIKTVITKFPFKVKFIDLFRNFGSTKAISAGIHNATGDAIFVLDADMQNPPELITEFIKKWEKGADIVYGRRTEREKLSKLRKIFTNWYYRFFNYISEVSIPIGTSEFALLDRKVADAFMKFGEQELFTKGIYAWVGGAIDFVDYVPENRKYGKTSFSPKTLFKLAFEGLFSFSTLPLRVWAFLGGFIALLSFTYMLFRILRVMIYGVDLPGYDSTIVIVLFIGGIQILGIGILGEYIGRIYKEVKSRPRYFIREITSNNPKNTKIK